MPRNTIKDYYNTLGIAPAADAEAIKRAYRKMALVYHPDKNPDNPYSGAHFKEILEAYQVLGKTKSREKYDEDRWLAGINNEAASLNNSTSILMACATLAKHINSVDTHRMDHKALQNYVLHILHEERMAIVIKDNDPKLNAGIINMLLKSMGRLRWIYLDDVLGKLYVLAANDATITMEIVKFYKQRKMEQRITKVTPYAIVLISILLAWGMYCFGNTH